MKKFVTTVAVVGLLAFAGSANAAAYVYTGGLLKVGSAGTSVYNLQACLAELGNNPHSNIDGVYGNITKAAVMSFQADKGAGVDGVIGPVTGPLYTAACAADMDDNNDNDVAEASDFDTTGGEEGEIVSGSLKIKLGDDDELFSGKKGQEAFTFEVEAEE